MTDERRYVVTNSIDLISEVNNLPKPELYLFYNY